MERYLGVNLLGPGPRLMKKNLPGRGLTEVGKHCSKLIDVSQDHAVSIFTVQNQEDKNPSPHKKKSSTRTPAS